jgi:hypothetical protein
VHDSGASLPGGALFHEVLAERPNACGNRPPVFLKSVGLLSSVHRSVNRSGRSRNWARRDDRTR